MITQNIPQPLGRKAFLFFLSRRMVAAGVLIFIALILAIVGNSLISGIASVMSAGGAVVNHATLVGIASFLSNAIFALFCLGLSAPARHFQLAPSTRSL